MVRGLDLVVAKGLFRSKQSVDMEVLPVHGVLSPGHKRRR